MFKFIDENETKISSSIKAMEKNTIPHDSVTDEYDYNSKSINVLGTSNNGELLVTIDDNLTEDFVIYFYCRNYDFEDFAMTNQNQGEEKIIIGKISKLYSENDSLNMCIELKYPNGNKVNSGEVYYTYVNTFNNKNENIIKSQDFSDKQYILLTNEIMFNYLYININNNGKYFYGMVKPTAESTTLVLTLKEGFLISAKYLNNVNIYIEDDGFTIKIKTDSDGKFEYITSNKEVEFSKSDGKLLCLARRNEDNTSIVEYIDIEGQNIVYDEKENNIWLVLKK